MNPWGDFHHATGAGWSVYWRLPDPDAGGLEIWWADFHGRRVLWKGSQPFAIVPYHFPVGGSEPPAPEFTYKDGLGHQFGGAPFTALKSGAPNADLRGQSQWVAGDDLAAVVVTTEPATSFDPAELAITAKFRCGWYQYVHRWEFNSYGEIHPSLTSSRRRPSCDSASPVSSSSSSSSRTCGLVRARTLSHRRGRTRFARPRFRAHDPDPSPRGWEDELGRQVAGLPPTGAFGEELARDPGVAMLRRLAEEVRAGMVTDGLPLTSRLLLLTLGREGFRELLERYWRAASPALFGITEADGFARFLAQEQLEVKFLPEVLAYEHALLRARRERATSTVRFHHDPAELLSALAAGELPDLPAIDECLVVVDVSTTPDAREPAWA